MSRWSMLPGSSKPGGFGAAMDSWRYQCQWSVSNARLVHAWRCLWPHNYVKNSKFAKSYASIWRVKAEWHAGARDLRTADSYISQLRKALIQDGETDPSEVPAIDSLKHASEMD